MVISVCIMFDIFISLVLFDIFNNVRKPYCHDANEIKRDLKQSVEKFFSVRIYSVLNNL